MEVKKEVLKYTNFLTLFFKIICRLPQSALLNENGGERALGVVVFSVRSLTGTRDLPPTRYPTAKVLSNERRVLYRSVQSQRV